MLLKAVRSKGLGNKIDPNRASILPTPPASADLTACLTDGLLLRVLGHLSENAYPCSLVCKRWLRLLGILKSTLRLKEWSFLESGRMTSRFPNLTDVDLSGAWLAAPNKQPSILFTHHFVTIHLGIDAYDPDSIERFIEDGQLTPSSLDWGLKVLADGCPGLQRLCLIDVRRPTYNPSSFRRRQASNTKVAEENIKQNGDGTQVNHHAFEQGAVKLPKDGDQFVISSLQPVKGDPSAKGGLACLARKCATLQTLERVSSFLDLYMEQEGSTEWVDIEELPPLVTPYPVLHPDDLNHNQAQLILKEEDTRIKSQGVAAFMVGEKPMREGLQGHPLSLEECKVKVPDVFVRTQLFRQSDRTRQKDPKRKYPPSLSQLQHVNLSRIILERFIEKNKCLPNNNQIPIYFVQQLYCEEFLQLQVNWDDKGALGGVALGRPVDKKRARLAGTSHPRTKPIVLTPEEQANMAGHLAEGHVLATQGQTATQLLQELQDLRIEVAKQNRTIERYRELYGELPAEPEFNVDEFIQQTVDLDA